MLKGVGDIIITLDLKINAEQLVKVLAFQLLYYLGSQRYSSYSYIMLLVTLCKLYYFLYCILGVKQE